MGLWDAIGLDISRNPSNDWSMKMYHNNRHKPVLGALLIALTSLSMPLSAAKINIHITTGGTLFTEEGVPSRLPRYVGNTPPPIIPGTEDLLDCHAIAQENPEYLKTTEAGALCNAVAQLQKHIQDPIEIDVEFLFANLAAIGAPAAIGASLPVMVDSRPNKENAADFARSYNVVISQLKKKNAKDLYNNPLVAHLPNYNQLNLTLPNDPFFQNNPDYPNNRWKPGGISLAKAQLKALGVRPSFNTQCPGCEEELSVYFKHTDIDFGMFLSDTEAAGTAITWDLNLSDGVGMLGPYTREVYNAIDFTNTATWPPGYNTTSPKRFVDLQGVVIHELSHGLGFISNIGDGAIGLPPPVDYPKAEQTIAVLDLFRFKNSVAASMNNINNFRDAPRFLAMDDIAGPYCNQSKGTAVAVLNFDKNGLKTVPLANGRNINPDTGAVIVGLGDGYQSSHYRNPFQRVPRPGLENNACNLNSQSATKSFFFFEDPPGKIMRPFSNYHNPTLITNEDLEALDTIGWNIDYSGNQPTVLDPFVPYNLNSALTPQAEFEKANGIEFKQKIRVIE